MHVLHACVGMCKCVRQWSLISAQLMRPGTGQIASCAVGDFNLGLFYSRERWFTRLLYTVY